MASTLDVNVLRESITKVTRILSGRGIKVTQRGSSAYVESNRKGEPVRVNLPYIPDSASEELINAIQGFLDHEVAHLMFTDFKVIGESARKGQLIQQFTNFVEDTYIERMMQKRFRGSASNLDNVGQFVLDKYTKPTVEGALAAGDDKKVMSALMVPAVRAWSGQKVFKDFMEDKWPLIPQVTEAIDEELRERIANVKSTRDSLNVAIAMQEALMPKPPESESEDTDEEEKESKKDGGNTGESDEDKGKKGADDEGEESTDPTEEEGDDEGESEGEESSGDADDDEEDEAGGSDAGEDEDDSDGAGTSGESSDEDADDDDEEDSGSSSPKMNDDEGEDDSGDEEDESEADDDEEDPEVEDEDEEPEDGEEDSKENEMDVNDDPVPEYDLDELTEMMADQDFDDAASFAISRDSMDESKDAEYLVYTKEYDIIGPPTEEMKHYQDSMLENLDDTVRHVVGPLQKNLERMILARQRSRWQPGLRRGRINSSSLFKLKTGDDRVFRRREVEGKTKDVAVTLLVDLSGSMYHNSRIYRAIEAAYAMAQVLNRVNVDFEVMGFTTKYMKMPAADRKRMMEEETKMGRTYSRYDSIYLPIFKSYDEPFRSEQKKRMAVTPYHVDMSSNLDGECVEYACERLLKRPNERKVLFVLSDGQPAAMGDWRAQHWHLVNTVKKFGELGVDIFGIGIETDVVKNFYPDYAVLDNVASLPSTLMEQLRRVMLD